MNNGYRMQPMQPMATQGVVYTGGGGEAACGPGDCGMLGDACLEPEGQSTAVNWRYVGGGKGGYEKMTTMRYVGEGGGGFQKEAPSCVANFAKCCMTVLLLAAVSLAIYFGFGALEGPQMQMPSMPKLPTSAMLLPTPAPSAKRPTSILTPAGHPEFSYDCAANAGGEWTMDRREYCCSMFGSKCNDPLPGPQAAHAQPPPKPPPTAGGPVVPQPVPANPADAAAVAVVFDCKAGLANWQQGWSDSKKSFCCHTAGIGCAPTKHLSKKPQEGKDASAQPASAPTTAAPAGGPAVARANAAQGVKHAPEQAATLDPAGVFDCRAGASNWEKGWSTIKKQSCCRSHKVACEPFNCEEDLSRYQTKWPEAKRRFCCDKKQLGCSMSSITAPVVVYACHAGLTHWEEGWSDSKKLWCCKHQQLGCPKKGPAKDPYDCQVGLAHWKEGWPSKKKAWCCSHKQLGCAAHPELKDRRYDCDEGFSKWQDAWSSHKKRWCCDHAKKGCAK